MRRRIAFFINGWNEESLERVLIGMRKNPYGESADIFVFQAYSTYNDPTDYTVGGLSIYNLPHIEDFDAAVIFATTFTYPEVAEKIASDVQKSGIPAVSIGIEYPGIPVIKIDSTTGMRELVLHLIKEHSPKEVAFIGGPKGHPDSESRLAITKEILRASGINFPEENIFYSNWDYGSTIRYTQKLTSGERTVPDTIICANDLIAMAAITDLSIRGYTTPGEVNVTGFDCIDRSRRFYPAITSVDPNYEQVGRKVMDVLFGEENNSVTIVDSVFRPAESCGCTKSQSFVQYRNEFCFSSYSTDLRNDMITYARQNTENAIVSADDFDSLCENLTGYYKTNRVFEGDNLYIILRREIYNDLAEDFRNVLSEELPDEYPVVTAIQEGKFLDVKSVSRHDIIPNYRETENAHTYYIVPLFMSKFNVGYTVFADSCYIFTDRNVHPYIHRMCAALLQLRTRLSLDTLNRNLSELYRRDPMTGLFNRFTYDETAVPLFDSQQAAGKRTMVCFIDINYMKHINDKYGHIHGDNAIKSVANAIMANKREGWLAMRYGGDEYMLIADCKDKDDAESIKQGIISCLDEDVKSQKLPYELGISCGYVITDPASSKTLSDYIREADEEMYKVKLEAHKKGMLSRRAEDKAGK